jgi:glycosyltransferase involved in cell wall biosynthesis
MEKITILFDCHTFDMEPQGSSTFLAGLLNALPGVMADFAGEKEFEIICAAENRQSVEKYVTVKYVFRQIKTGFLLRNLFYLPKLASQLNADFVVSQYVRPIWVPRYAVSIIHDVLFVDFPDQFNQTYRMSRWFFFGLSARFSDKVFTISNYSKDRISRVFRIHKSKIGVLQCAAQIDQPTLKVNKPGRSRGPIKLLYVSRLERRKRHEWCIRALEDLLAEGVDAELTVVGGGRGEYAEKLRRLFRDKSNRLNGRMVHREGVPAEELEELFGQADLLLYPSLGEGFGIPIIEAAVRGLPCVVSDGSALSELKESFVGESFEPSDYQAFFEAIKKVVSGIDSYSLRAQENRLKVAQRYTWKVAAKEFMRGIMQLRS